MRINVILFTLFLNWNCQGYKLRRDIREVRQYCEKICTGCGGKPTLRLDVCVCTPEEEPRIDKCFEKAQTKLGFLGIKWELPHRPLAKRSIYSPNYPSPIDHDIYYKRGRKSFTKRSEGSLKDSPAKTQIMGIEWGLKPKQDSPKEGKSRQPRSLEQFKIIVGANRFSENLFQPVQDYHSRLEAPFKLLLAGSGPKNFDQNTYYGALNEPNNESVQRDGDVDDHDDGDVSSSEELTDYEYAQNCEDAVNLQRYDAPQSREFRLFQQIKALEPQTSEKRMRSILASTLLPEIYNQYFYHPKNYHIIM